MSTRTCLAQRGLCTFIASAALLFLGASLSGAQAADDPPNRVIHYAQQDVTSEAGAQHLLQRIEAASHEVCADQERQPLALQQAARRCYLAAVERAVDATNAPRLSAAYLAKYGTVAPADEARARAARGMPRSRQG